MINITDQELIEYFNEYGSYYAVARETGLSPSTVKERLNQLGYKSEYDKEYGRQWVRLSQQKLGPSRTISIPGIILRDVGLHDSDLILGKWSTNKDGSLTLTLKKS